MIWKLTHGSLLIVQILTLAFVLWMAYLSKRAAKRSQAAYDRAAESAESIRVAYVKMQRARFEYLRAMDGFNHRG